MKTCVLIRKESNADGTIGRLYIDEKTFFFTLELPDYENKPRKSCIPTGDYLVKWTLSPRLKKYTYEIVGVPKRAGIRIHGGNFAGTAPPYLSHSLGCPLLGLKEGSRTFTKNGKTLKQKMVLSSRLAVRKFEQIMHKESFILSIRQEV